MFRNERKNEIIRILSAQGYMTVADLSKLLFTSESSIRRDLIALEKEGLVQRSYGGVELSKNNARLVPFALRLHSRIREKKLMAEKAAALVGEKDVVFLDQSSSALFLAQELFRLRRNITILTNNLEILCSEQPPGVTVYATGGRVSGYRRCLIGENATPPFYNMWADFAFFSAGALTPEGVIFDNTLEEVKVKEAMLKNAAKKVFLCDSQKFDRYAGYRQCALNEVDYMVSEVSCKEKYKNIAPNVEFL